MQICPHCNTQFDWNDSDSEYQVNDHFELIFCSFECSKVYSFDYICDNIETITIEEIKSLTETV